MNSEVGVRLDDSESEDEESSGNSEDESELEGSSEEQSEDEESSEHESEDWVRRWKIASFVFLELSFVSTYSILVLIHSQIFILEFFQLTVCIDAYELCIDTSFLYVSENKPCIDSYVKCIDACWN